MLPKNIRFFYGFMLKEKRYLIIFILFGILNISLDIFEPTLAQTIINKALNLTDLFEIKYWGFIWLSIFLIKYFIRFLYNKFKLKFVIDVMYKIQLTIFQHVLSLPISYFKNNSVGYIMSRQLDDVVNLDGIMLNNVVNGILSLIEIIIILIMMFKINILLAVISIIIKSLDVIVNFSFPLKKLYKDHNEARSFTSKELQDILSGIKLIKIANSMQYEEHRFKEILKNYYATRNTRDKIEIVRTISTNFLNEMSTPLIIIMGGIFIYQQIITIGEVMAFILYFQKINSVFGTAVSLIPLFKISQGSAERIYELFNLDPEFECSSTNDKLRVHKSIEFKNITFSYGENNILNNICMKFYPKKINAIVGVSGSGKSTLVDLLLRLNVETSGEILIDGKNINEYHLSTIRNSIAFLSQEAILFNRSLLENIAYNLKDKKTISDKLIYEALEKAFATSIVLNLPNRLNTVIGDRGNTISGGEKQRICIARELLKNSDIIIFDEATSALDSISEEMIQKTINELAKTKIIIIIAHRLSTIKNSDIIYVLDKGYLLESGTHEELLSQNGLYFSLYSKQQE